MEQHRGVNLSYTGGGDPLFTLRYIGDVVAQLIECQTAVLQFQGLILAGVNLGIPNLGDHLLGREPGSPKPATDVDVAGLCRPRQRRRKTVQEAQR